MTATPSGVEPVEQIQQAVRERYARAALAVTDPNATTGCCGPDCCSSTGASDTATAGPTADPITRDLYHGAFAEDAEATSATALQASLGCGNPLLLAELSPGEIVLDLGSGGGLDVLLSARRVGPTGRAYGLDMTPEMLDLARRNRDEAGVTNAEFLFGTIEDIPLRDGLVDVVISNCVINLSGDKDAVLAEAFRVTRPGGRFAVADVVLLGDLPDAVRPLMALWTGCIAGALRDEEYVAKLTAAGYVDVGVEVTRRYDRAALEGLAAGLADDEIPAGLDVEGVVDALDGVIAGAFVRARKP